MTCHTALAQESGALPPHQSGGWGLQGDKAKKLRPHPSPRPRSSGSCAESENSSGGDQGVDSQVDGSGRT